MIRALMLVPLVALLLACGSSTHVETQGDVAIFFPGDTSVEEKILQGDVIVRATMTSFSSEVATRANGKYSPVLKFNLNVSEYLKGAGSSSIVAVWVDGWFYDTRKEAESKKTGILAERDAQWDNREAVIFLYDGRSGFGATLDAQLKLADHFLLALGYQNDDRYSLHSRTNKDWLPAVSASTASGASSSSSDKEFLLDVPSTLGGAATASGSSTTPTITLGSLKKRISELAAELNGGDGSEAYKECVKEKHSFERRARYYRELDGSDSYDKSPTATELKSGQTANTMLHQWQNYGNYPSQRAKTWLEGGDAVLFTVVQGATTTPYDVDRDGKLTAPVDGIEFTETFTTVRPLPAGEYDIVRKEVWAKFLACNYVLSHDWTITVTAPTGTLHEMFFDPVAVGSAVAADATNGVLKPRAFTMANSATATVSRIAYEPASGSGQSGSVKVAVTPGNALAGHALDFIDMKGTTTLSLSASAATSTAGTLTWAVPKQPWKAGDKLMLRIRSLSTSTPPVATSTPP